MEGKGWEGAEKGGRKGVKEKEGERRGGEGREERGSQSTVCLPCSCTQSRQYLPLTGGTLHSTSTGGEATFWYCGGSTGRKETGS